MKYLGMQLDSAQVSRDGMFPVGDCMVAIPLPFDILLKGGWIYLGGMFSFLGIWFLYSRVVSSLLVEKGTQSNYRLIWEYSKISNA